MLEACSVNTKKILHHELKGPNTTEILEIIHL